VAPPSPPAPPPEPKVVKKPSAEALASLGVVTLQKLIDLAPEQLVRRRLHPTTRSERAFASLDTEMRYRISVVLVDWACGAPLQLWRLKTQQKHENLYSLRVGKWLVVLSEAKGGHYTITDIRPKGE
jgi:hypothetical protein